MRALTAIVLTALALSPTIARSATWTVDPNGSADATTIQAGVNLASPGCGAVSIEPMSWGAIKSQYR